MTQPGNAPTEVNWFYAMRLPNGRSIVWVYPLDFDGTQDTPERARGLTKAQSANQGIDPAVNSVFSTGMQPWFDKATFIDWTKGVPA
jgi:hypothetical protein